jgi:hypothetical protein
MAPSSDTGCRYFADACPGIWCIFMKIEKKNNNNECVI